MSSARTDSDENDDDFASSNDVAQTLEGIRFVGLQVDDVLQVETVNSTYRFVLNDPASGQVEVTGGRTFTTATHGVLTGSPVMKGSTSIRPSWIYLGQPFEVQYVSAVTFEPKVLHSSSVKRIIVNGHVILPCNTWA